MLDAIGVVRWHRDRLDIAYLETTLKPICELARSVPLAASPTSDCGWALSQ
jgi:hypothetical protein